MRDPAELRSNDAGRITEATYEGERPGEGWNAHTLLDYEGVVGRPPRPPRVADPPHAPLAAGRDRSHLPQPSRLWDVPHSPYGLDVSVFVLAARLLAACGLHHVDWPWCEQDPERPAPRTAQRMLRRPAPQADRWLLGLRLARFQPVSAYLAITPPRGQRNAVRQQLADTSWTLRDGQSVSFVAETLRGWIRAYQWEGLKASRTPSIGVRVLTPQQIERLCKTIKHRVPAHSIEGVIEIAEELEKVPEGLPKRSAVRRLLAARKRKQPWLSVFLDDHCRCILDAVWSFNNDREPLMRAFREALRRPEGHRKIAALNRLIKSSFVAQMRFRRSRRWTS